MAKVTVADPTAQATIEIGDPTPLGKLQLLRLAVTGGIVGEFNTTVERVQFDSTTLGVTFPAPTVNIDPARSLTVSAGINGSLMMYRTSDSPLLGSDPAVPEIAIGASDYWLSFGLDATFCVSGGVSASGFGVSVNNGVAFALTGYTLLDKTAQFGDALRAALENFAPLCSATAVRNQKAGTVLVADIRGTVTVSGSYSLPVSVNQLSLGEATVPFTIDINPNLGATVTGAVS